MRRNRTILLALPAASVLVASAAFANAGSFSATLDPVPHAASADGGSNVTGDASLRLTGVKLAVDLEASGLTPGEPHAMHIHGETQAANECPGIEADTGTGDFADPFNTAPAGDPDGLISVGEGAGDYGPILTSFTTEGDTSAASGLDLERMVVADEDGDISYHRSIKVPQYIAKNLGALHIVIHGADLPFDNDESSLSTLFEATLPVACGAID